MIPMINIIYSGVPTLYVTMIELALWTMPYNSIDTVHSAKILHVKSETLVAS